jgi:cyclohexanecarboxylate-CoA ligase
MTSEQRREAYRRDGWWSGERLFDLFDAAARRRPEACAVVDPPNRSALVGTAACRLSWRELDARQRAFAERLSEQGLRRGDVLVTQLPNIAEYLAVYVAALRQGVVVSPVPMQYGRHELAQIFALTGARAWLSVPAFRGANPAPAAREAATQAAVDVKLLALGDARQWGFESIDRVGDAASGEAPMPAAPDAAQAVRSSDVATICWTSGTEGTPKGVPRTHDHWLAISHAHFEGAGIRQGDKLLNPFPLVNMAALGGCFLSWLRSAGTLVQHHPLDLAVYLQQIALEKPDYAIAPPAVLNMLLKDDKLLASTDLSSLRCIGSGSAPLDPSMIRGFKDRFGIEIVNLFGSNEGMSLCSSAAEAPEPETRARLFPRFGRAEIEWPRKVARAIETRLVDPDSGAEIVDRGLSGEMQIRGPTVFDGYYRAPETQARVFTEDGWFRTGDLFEIAGDEPIPRFYRFVGRLKQIIVRGGVKISPDELEAVLARHPGIAEASAIAFPDERLGERICAVLVMRVGHARVSLEDLQNLFRDAGVAVFKWPERVRFIDALPRNPVGKVLRAQLSALAAAPEA